MQSGVKRYKPSFAWFRGDLSSPLQIPYFIGNGEKVATFAASLIDPSTVGDVVFRINYFDRNTGATVDIATVTIAQGKLAPADNFGKIALDVPSVIGLGKVIGYAFDSIGTGADGLSLRVF